MAGRNESDIVRIAQLEKAIKESQFIAEESERRFDETNKKVEMFDSDLERTYDRADSAEAYEKFEQNFDKLFFNFFFNF